MALPSDNDNGHVRYVTVHLTDECNLNCTYCFSRPYRFGKHMSADKARRFATWFAAQAEDGVYAVTFFGGEPFLRSNLMPIIVNTLKEHSKPNTTFNFSATSNGTLIRLKHIEMLRDHKISVMVSTDGDQPTHDRYRVYSNGRGSFSSFLKGVLILQQVQKRITARLTFTPGTVDRLVTNHEALLLKYGFWSVAASPVTEASWDEASFDLYEQQLFELAGMLLEQWQLGRFIRLRILEKPILELMLGEDKGAIRYPCGAGRTAAGIGADGKIYPCHRFVGMDEYVIGTIEAGIDSKARTAFWEPPVKTGTLCFRGGCTMCDLKSVCRGECYQVALEATGNIKEPPRSHYRLTQKSIYVAGCLLDYILEEEPRLLERILEIKSGSLMADWRERIGVVC